jgi:hypothetical protein
MDEGAGVYYQKEGPFHVIANVCVSGTAICVVFCMPDDMR